MPQTAIQSNQFAGGGHPFTLGSVDQGLSFPPPAPLPCTCLYHKSKLRTLKRAGGKEVDPSRTKMIRRAFEREMSRRFKAVAREIVHALTVDDVLGLIPDERPDMTGGLDVDSIIRANHPELKTLGGEGSGNFGHEGRPGMIGGSGEGAGIDPAQESLHDKHYTVSRQDEAGGYKIEFVNIEAFDRAWKNTDADAYIAEDGKGNAIKDRYSKFQDYFSRNHSIEVSSVSVHEDGAIVFSNGRHRYSAMRDRREGNVPVAMDRESRKNAIAFHYIEGLKANLQKHQYKFATTAKKVDEFMNWVDERMDMKIIKTSGRRIAGNKAWMNTHIESAYKKGMSRAYMEIHKVGKDLPGHKYLNMAFNSPIHADAAGMIFTRVYSDLKGVTDAMSAKMSRTLAQGLIDGEGPNTIAREMARDIEDIGIVRAKMIARTEVIRAHHVANINVYREAGIDGVTVTAEWLTAGDDRVCEICQGNAETEDGKKIIYTLDEIEGMIPAHPNCRCTAIPAEETFNGLLEKVSEQVPGTIQTDEEDQID